MGPRAGEVVACETLVKGYGRGETLHEGIGSFRETATPKFPAAFAHCYSFLPARKQQV